MDNGDILSASPDLFASYNVSQEDSNWLADRIQHFVETYCGKLALPLLLASVTPVTCNSADQYDIHSTTDYSQQNGKDGSVPYPPVGAYPTPQYTPSNSQSLSQVDDLDETPVESKKTPRVDRTPPPKNKTSLRTYQNSTNGCSLDAVAVLPSSNPSDFGTATAYASKEVESGDVKVTTVLRKHTNAFHQLNPLRGELPLDFGYRWTKVFLERLHLSPSLPAQIFRLQELIKPPIAKKHIRVLEDEKSAVKSGLKSYDQIFSKFYGNAPTHAQKEPLRPLYAYYHRIKIILQRLKGYYQRKHMSHQMSKDQSTLVGGVSDTYCLSSDYGSQKNIKIKAATPSLSHHQNVRTAIRDRPYGADQRCVIDTEAFQRESFIPIAPSRDTWLLDTPSNGISHEKSSPDKRKSNMRATCSNMSLTDIPKATSYPCSANDPNMSSTTQ